MGIREPSTNRAHSTRHLISTGDTVVDAENQRGIVRRSVDSPSGDQLVVELERGEMLLIPSSLLTQQSDDLFSLGYSFDALLQMSREDELDLDGTLVVPVMEEEVLVGKQRSVTGRVRVHKTVEEREETITTPITYDEVRIERVGVNRLVKEPVTQRQEGDTLVIPVHKEVLVVEKRLMLVEEIHISKQQREEEMQESVTLRKENVTVERVES